MVLIVVTLFPVQFQRYVGLCLVTAGLKIQNFHNE
jgi:hypothetical protein